jgi:PHD/YefM family antitoxin component YafN of YafNO toxin-antitoxin module
MMEAEADMALMDDIQYISDEEGNPTGVIVPIEIWREIASERETAYLLRSDTMRRRLLEARERREEIPFDEVRQKLGL